MDRRNNHRRQQSVRVEKDFRNYDDRRQEKSWNNESSAASGYTDLKLFPNGEYQSFTAQIDTFWNILGRDVRLLDGAKVEFHENGALKSCRLASSIEFKIHGVKTIVKKGCPVQFYASGSPHQFTVDEQRTLLFLPSFTWVYRGKKFNAGTVITLSENGDLVQS